MPSHRDPRPNVPKPPSTDNPGTDPRPHVAALRELSVLGWRVTEIRPDRALWRVTVTRYDGDATIGVTDSDPDEALDEAVRYAAVDAEEARDPVAALEEGAGSADPEARAAFVAQLEALGWELLERRSGTFSSAPWRTRWRGADVAARQPRP
ncbi:MAG TPA: hypothetical protein VNO30_46945 [Kofleriaceae bacterium]|nr:hypothetical protein [Kofleriaceae bacterium]